MPNQLAKSKRRQSLAEHEAVFAALASIAEHDKVTLMDLMRAAVRQSVKARAADPALARKLREAVLSKAPRLPADIRTPARVARFKREQRAFDQVLLDLAILAPTQVQQRNSIAPSPTAVRLLNFDAAHA